MGLLAGKVAVVTGSSRGLGLAIARAYAQQGAAVVLSSRTLPAVDQAVADLRQNGFSAVGQACDTADPLQVEALANLAVTRFGKLDIWVNNAGAGAPYGPTLSVPRDRFVRVVQTNILGVYYGSMAAMQRFIPQKSGKLINLIGRGADKPVPYQNAYASSKIWVRSFTKSLAQEYTNSGVGVYIFNPGLVLTDMTMDVEAIEGYGQRLSVFNTILRMWGNLPHVPANKAVWLASAATNGKTGLEVSVLTPGLVVRGALGELARRLFRRPVTIKEVKVTDIPPAVPVEAGNQPRR
jgi:NAD(P)-dependent dehydrogenase (short-subunit alcohol dehydrogenase family)